jgi:membrane protein YdbS with pleckstrin-like domain
MNDPAAEESGDDASGSDADGGLERPDGPPEWLSLDEGEELQWVGQPSSATLIPAAVWGVLLLVVAGLGLVVFAASYLSVKNTDYVVTSTTLYHKTGILSTNIESVGLDRIQNTEFSQSFAGKQLGYGTTEISTAGSSGSDLAFRNVDDPREVRDLVNRLGPSAGGATGGDQEPAGGGADEQLLRELLAELRAVNESMSNVERMLRDGQAGGSAGSGSNTRDGSGSTTRSTATSPGRGESGAGRGAPGSGSSGGTGDAGGSGGAGGGGAGGGGAGGGGAGGGGAGGGGASGADPGPDRGGPQADDGDDGAEDPGDTAREFISDSDESEDDDEEPPAPPFGGEGG